MANSGAFVVNTAIAVPRNNLCRNGAAGTKVVPAHQHKRGRTLIACGRANVHARQRRTGVRNRAACSGVARYPRFSGVAGVNLLP
jgi:hypothetical protein